MMFRLSGPLTVLLAMGSLFAATVSAEGSATNQAQEVDKIFAPYDKPDSPGCALGVVRNGEFLYKRGYGSASLELNVPLTPQSIFYMASASKQFTAASMVLAAEQGYLSLDDDVRKYVSEMPTYGYVITLRQMLHHTSGYRDILGLVGLAGEHIEDIHSTAELLDLVSRQQNLNNVPGDKYLYSNTNYWLMSVIIQRATGKSLAQFAEENIFRPLDMTHTRFYDDRTAVVRGRVAAYKPLAGGGFAMDWNTNFDEVGAGGLMSSVEDLLNWDRNFYANKLGKGTLLQELQTPGKLNSGKKTDYALGLQVSTYRGLPIVEHEGGLFGYRTELLRFPQQNFSVICLCNLATVRPRILANQVADIYLKGLLSPERHAEIVHVDPQPFAGQYRNSKTHSVLDVSAVEGNLVINRGRWKATGPREFVNDWGQQISFEVVASKPMVLTAADPGEQPVMRRFERLQPLKLSETDLAQYIGPYTSSELQATYRFAEKAGQLTMTVNWEEPSVLTPSIRDEFQTPEGMSIVFHRDSSGRVFGCDLFADRVAQIAFARNAPSNQ